MPLTDVAIRSAKPDRKAIKFTDEKGMFLLITPAGGKLWRLRYRFDGREKLLAMGAYPEIGLSDARKRRDEVLDNVARCSRLRLAWARGAARFGHSIGCSNAPAGVAIWKGPSSRILAFWRAICPPRSRFSADCD